MKNNLKAKSQFNPVVTSAWSCHRTHRSFELRLKRTLKKLTYCLASHFVNAPTFYGKATVSDSKGSAEGFNADIQSNHLKKKCTGIDRALEKKKAKVDELAFRLLSDTTTNEYNHEKKDWPLPAEPLSDASRLITFPPRGDSLQPFGTDEKASSGSLAPKAWDNGTIPFPPLHSEPHDKGKVSQRTSLEPVYEDPQAAKKRPSLAELRRRSMTPTEQQESAINGTQDSTDTEPGSRFFRSSSGSPASLLNRRPTSPRKVSLSNISRLSISRPILQNSPLSSNMPSPLISPPTFSFTKPVGPTPLRPSRPASLDNETLDFMRDNTTRMVLPPSFDYFNTSGLAPNDPNSTATPSKKRTTPSSSNVVAQQTRASIEARLGLPAGHSVPRNDDTPELGAKVPFGRRLSSGDGVDPADRELGAIEQYNEARSEEWVEEKRVSGSSRGGLGQGTLWKDRSGRYHFVRDI
ncbi:hypothetical protein BS50DRAFT_618569 [Corynespora cassiicola Philippines]|uniref:Uncharacterized protein n=1 Tax=Corynespora cassiicola Philippines TaxID=1448308 RepID=A0A2T2P1P4_CORCC|nr:hypothetical protein BS50DRAFT_618569 [Corynespora cassiicola Philippines]